jgi:hypothetical protein
MGPIPPVDEADEDGQLSLSMKVDNEYLQANQIGLVPGIVGAAVASAVRSGFSLLSVSNHFGDVPMYERKTRRSSV